MTKSQLPPSLYQLPTLPSQLPTLPLHLTATAESSSPIPPPQVDTVSSVSPRKYKTGVLLEVLEEVLELVDNNDFMVEEASYLFSSSVEEDSGNSTSHFKSSTQTKHHSPQ